jgi:hypothetical protein
MKNITPTGIILPKIFRFEGGTGDFITVREKEKEKERERKRERNKESER